MGGKGSGGWNKTTPSLHHLRGTYRKDRHGHLKESKSNIVEKLLGVKNNMTSQGVGRQTQPRPPMGLSKESRAIWKRTVNDYDFINDPVGLMFLEQALNSYDIALGARKHVKEHGTLLLNEKTGNLYSNPSLGIERQFMNLYLKFWKELNLER